MERGGGGRVAEKQNVRGFFVHFYNITDARIHEDNSKSERIDCDWIFYIQWPLQFLGDTDHGDDAWLKESTATGFLHTATIIYSMEQYDSVRVAESTVNGFLHITDSREHWEWTCTYRRKDSDWIV